VHSRRLAHIRRLDGRWLMLVPRVSRFGEAVRPQFRLGRTCYSLPIAAQVAGVLGIALKEARMDPVVVGRAHQRTLKTTVVKGN
jgi:hypothetical protein